MYAQIYAFLKPKALIQTALFLRKITGISSLLLFLIGIVGGLFLVSADYQQGDYARILYVHVPASWGALAIYSCMAILSAVGLITRMPQFFFDL